MVHVVAELACIGQSQELGSSELVVLSSLAQRSVQRRGCKGTQGFQLLGCDHLPLIIRSTMACHVFAATSKCKSWTGTGFLVKVDCVFFAIAALDFDFI